MTLNAQTSDQWRGGTSAGAPRGPLASVAPVEANGGAQPRMVAVGSAEHAGELGNGRLRGRVHALATNKSRLVET